MIPHPMSLLRIQPPEDAPQLSIHCGLIETSFHCFDIPRTTLLAVAPLVADGAKQRAGPEIARRQGMGLAA